MTRAMLLGAGVLIVSQFVLVLVAVLWYRRTQKSARTTFRPPEGSERETRETDHLDATGR